jgi:hypothetical protein
MQNVKLDVSKDGKTLTIVIGLKAKTTPSASGKTQIVASTRGSVEIAGVMLGVNCYRYADK